MEDSLKYKNGVFTVNGETPLSQSAITEISNAVETVSANTNQFETIENPEYLEVKIDNDGKVIEGITTDGIKHIYNDVELNNAKAESVIFKEVELDSATFSTLQKKDDFISVMVDANNKVLKCIKKDGTLYIPKLESPTLVSLLKEAKEYTDEKSGAEDIKEATNLKTIGQNIRMFSSMICCGDSVTDGHIYNNYRGCLVSRKYSYPSQLQKMFPEIAITNAGFSGITVASWNKSRFPNYNFTDYGLCLIELGFNGGIPETFDTDVAPFEDYHDYADTAMGNYCQLIKKIQEASPFTFIILVCSRGFGKGQTWVSVQRIGKEFDLPIIDLTDSTLYPMDYEDAPGVHASPWGYLTKASYIQLGIGRAIAKYKSRAVRCVFGQNDWIWKVTANISEPSVGRVYPEYSEVVASELETLTCEVDEDKATFDGWYYEDLLVSRDKSYQLDTFSIQPLRNVIPKAITITARVTLK